MTQKRNRTAFFYILPCLIVLGLFVYYPLIMNLVYSFQSFGMSDTTREFVGLANFKKLFSDEIILTSLKNNVLYAVISVIIQVGFGLVLAAVLEDRVFQKFSPFSGPPILSQPCCP